MGKSFMSWNTAVTGWKSIEEKYTVHLMICTLKYIGHVCAVVKNKCGKRIT